MLNQHASWIPVRRHSPLKLFQFLEGFDVRVRIDCLTSGHHIHQNHSIRFPIYGDHDLSGGRSCLELLFSLVFADDATLLAQKDFHLFGPLKDALRGAKFEDDDSVIRAVRTWLREQETSWYKEGMHALVSRWRRAVDGDYVEK